jgi:hypothetical protein
VYRTLISLSYAFASRGLWSLSVLAHSSRACLGASSRSRRSHRRRLSTRPSAATSQSVSQSVRRSTARPRARESAWTAAHSSSSMAPCSGRSPQPAVFIYRRRSPFADALEDYRIMCAATQQHSAPNATTMAHHRRQPCRHRPPAAAVVAAAVDDNDVVRLRSAVCRSVFLRSTAAKRGRKLILSSPAANDELPSTRRISQRSSAQRRRRWLRHRVPLASSEGIRR